MCEFFPDARGVVGLAAGDLADGGDDLVDFRGFAHIPQRPGLGCAPDALGVFEDRKQHHPGLGKLGADLRGDLVAIAVRQFVVHGHHVRPQTPIERDGLVAVFRLAHENHVGVAFDRLGEGEADHGMIIDDQDADWGCHGCLLSFGSASGDE